MAGPVLAVAAAAGLALGSAPALAAAGPALVAVPCRVTALTADLAAASSGETLQLAPSCRYVLTAALPLIRENLTILGEGATLERSYAPGTPDFTILTVWSGKVSIQRLNFRHGDSESGGAIDNGGVTVEATSVVTVSGGTFSDNTAGYGGAIFDNTGATLIVQGAVFADNSSGIYNSFSPDPGRGQITVLKVTGSSFTGNGDGIDNDGDATVTRSAFTGNDSGIYNETGAQQLAVTDSDFSQNTRSGLLNEGYSTVTGGSFIRNSTPYTGGGIDNTSDGPTSLTVTGTSFTGNSAGEGGGGIYNYDAAQVTRATFTGNHAPVGGGMENAWYAVVADSSFRGNSAGSDGGGLYNDCEATVSGSIFAQNKAGSDGGGIGTTFTPLAECFAATFVHLTDSQIRGNIARADGGGIYTVDTVATPGLGSVSVSGGQIRGNVAGGDGGGIFNSGGTNVTLSGAVVTGNLPDNCVPLGSVPGCTR